jgi:dTDP-4-dehydrorhamnose 3,5-epimerase-like enzyme
MSDNSSHNTTIRPSINICKNFDIDIPTQCGVDVMSNIPIEINPLIHIDKRGGFSESLNCVEKECYGECSNFIKDILSNTKQINRNISYSGVCRGFHAQKAPYCQGKLVECLSLSTPIWDIIIDARPDSKTFQHYQLFKLNGDTMNKLWIPRGFLHCMIASKYAMCDVSEDGGVNLSECTVPAEMQYFTDNEFNKESEVGVNPKTILPYIINEYFEEFKANNEKDISLIPLFKTVENGLIISEKDEKLPSYIDFMKEVEDTYKESGKLWYR